MHLCVEVGVLAERGLHARRGSFTLHYATLTIGPVFVYMYALICRVFSWSSPQCAMALVAYHLEV